MKIDQDMNMVKIPAQFIRHTVFMFQYPGDVSAQRIMSGKVKAAHMILGSENNMI